MSSVHFRWGEKNRTRKNEKKMCSMTGLYTVIGMEFLPLRQFSHFRPTSMFLLLPFCVCVYRHDCHIVVATTFTIAVNNINSENKLMQLLVMCLWIYLHSVFWYHFTLCLILWLKNLSARKMNAWKNYVQKSHQIEEYIWMFQEFNNNNNKKK